MAGTTRAAIDAVLRQGVTEGVYPGAALLVAQGEAVLYSGVAGEAAVVPYRRPLTLHMHWDIASLTKPVAIATILLRLVETEGLDLHQTRVAGRFSLWELLHHTSGLPAWVALKAVLSPEHLAGDETALRAAVTEGILASGSSSPLARTCYSDLGFILIGFWLEDHLGARLDRLFDAWVAQPLGLSHTGYRPLARGIASEQIVATQQSPRRGQVQVGEVDDDNAALLGGVAGHAGLFSTVEDVHLWLNDIRLSLQGKGSLFKRETLRPLLETRPPFGRFHLGFDTPSAIGSQAGTHFSPQTIGHLGFTGCSFWLDLKTGWEVIFFTNRVHPDPANDAIKRFRPYLHDAVYRICNGS